MQSTKRKEGERGLRPTPEKLFQFGGPGGCGCINRKTGGKKQGCIAQHPGTRTQYISEKPFANKKKGL